MLESQLLDHERLDAYRVALELEALVVRIAAGMGRRHAGLRDQNRVRISKAQSLRDEARALLQARARG